MSDNFLKDLDNNLIEKKFHSTSKEISQNTKEKIILYGKTYEVDHFKLSSKDMNLPKDKRLDFNIWYDQKSSMILKVTYSRMGSWEYRLKNFE